MSTAIPSKAVSLLDTSMLSRNMRISRLMVHFPCRLSPASDAFRSELSPDNSLVTSP